MLISHLLQVSNEECIANVEAAKSAVAKDPTDLMANLKLIEWQYVVSKYVRKDNTPEMAKYLGYLDAKELYPDFKPITFAKYLDELLAGKGQKPYQGRY
jgi:hypothetical protein